MYLLNGVSQLNSNGEPLPHICLCGSFFNNFAIRLSKWWLYHSITGRIVNPNQSVNMPLLCCLPSKIGGGWLNMNGQPLHHILWVKSFFSEVHRPVLKLELNDYYNMKEFAKSKQQC